MRSRWRRVAVLIGACACLFAVNAGATPDKASWRRQLLIGQGAMYYFRYVAVSDQPGTHYGYSRKLWLEKVRKADFRVVESIPLMSVTHEQEFDSGRWSASADTLPAFDLPTYLRKNAVELTFPDDLAEVRRFTIDSEGVWEVFEDGRVQLATRKELERQVPILGENPRVVGIESTGALREDDVFLRIVSGSTAWDSDWAEDLLMVRGALLR